jgi:hypothetical protein
MAKYREAPYYYFTTSVKLKLFNVSAPVMTAPTGNNSAVWRMFRRIKMKWGRPVLKVTANYCLWIGALSEIYKKKARLKTRPFNRSSKYI